MNPLTDKMKGTMTLAEEDESTLILDDVDVQNSNLDIVLVARVLTTKFVFLSTLQRQIKDYWNGRLGPFLWFRVKCDVTKPLLRGRNIQLKQTRDKFWVDFRYERLPEWCMECGRLGHPFPNCLVWMKKMYNGIELEILYGPELKGVALLTFGYDRYRTDFSKENAWPLRLARNSLVSAVLGLSSRTPPQPRPLFTSAQSVAVMDTNLCATAITPPPTIVKFTLALLTNITNKNIGAKDETSWPSASIIAQHKTSFEHVDVNDLSDIYMPDVGTIATYPLSPSIINTPRDERGFKTGPTTALSNPTLSLGVEPNESVSGLEVDHSAGVTESSQQGMTTIISSYFEELFTASPIDSSAIQHTLNTIPTTVTAAMNGNLTKQFTPDEILAALKSMSLDKSFGSD
uniref:Zinc knuckle CX2CX4HX4C domain-containing protein n=1 Tax=Cannabis sativa TaxID=3483 RepID=A0A803Q0X0_CANSA